ncbi:torsin family member [Dermatophagoides pteronyssinus]|uniref:torsin family member n=1 Tax=Dermatophagoides pteronyssinus TaxID=6956 RepID=UPI003F67DEA2
MTSSLIDEQSKLVVYKPTIHQRQKNKISIMYIIKIILMIPIWTTILALDPFSITGSIIVGTGMYYFKDSLTCMVKECCHDHTSNKWIANRLKWSDLPEEIFGQHIAVSVVSNLVYFHLRNPNPPKPLVLSFHGFTGVGKTHLSDLLAKRIYRQYNETGSSKFVHKYTATHLNKESQLSMLVENIFEKLEACDRSLVIIDEIDKLPEKYLDILLPYLDHSSPYKKSIFIFLGNSAGSNINNEVVHLLNSGKAREDIEYDDLENVVTNNAVKVGGLKNSELITRGVIDLFVPFLPLSKHHIRQCVADNLRRQHEFPDPFINPGSKFIDKVTDSIEFKDDEFSVFGCKRVSSKVAILLARKNRL